MWVLTIRSTKTGPQDYVLDIGKNTLGRKADNDIVINDEMASRLHAEIDCQPNRVVITDLGSTNGTFVNRKRITQPVRIYPDDQIRIGYHLVNISEHVVEPTGDASPISSTQSLTKALLLESYEQNAVLIYEVASRLTAVLDLNAALDKISDFLQTVIGAEKCHLILATQFEDFNQLDFPKTIIQQAIDHSSVVVYQDPRNPDQSARSKKIQAALCVPILEKAKPVALLLAYNTNPDARPFDHNDILLAVAASHQAAMAIQREKTLKNVQETEKWTRIDRITGLDSQSQIFKKATREFIRARRFQRPLTAIMMAIDNIDQVNEFYGHNIRNQMIKSVAKLCSRQLRSIDIIGRYGEDKFLILLVETNTPNAMVISERLRRNISQSTIKTDHGPISITISMGIAPMTKKFSEVHGWIDCADDALVAAQKSGKDHFEVLL